MTSARGRARAWAELLRISAVFTVPGDALAGAAATRTAPNRGTALAVGASVCLYEAGMALNDWADRDIDAVERPGRPLPSGRITPTAAVTAATALTGAGLVCAALAGRRTLATAAALAGTVWAYDLGLKNTPAGPYAMATARSLDLLLGATATHAPAARQAVAPAALLGAHTLAVTGVSRHETTGGSSKAPVAALATAAAIAWTATRPPARTAPAARNHRAPTTTTGVPTRATTGLRPGTDPTAGGQAAATTSVPLGRGFVADSRAGSAAGIRPRPSPARALPRRAASPRPGVGPAVGGWASATTTAAAADPRPSRTGALARRAAAPIASRPPACRSGLPASRPPLRGLAVAAIRAALPVRSQDTSSRPGAVPRADGLAGVAAMAAAADLRPSRTGALARRAGAPIASGPPAPRSGLPVSRPALRGPAAGPRPGAAARRVARPGAQPTHALAAAALGAAYLATAARPLAHAALNPSPHLLQRAVGGGIRAMIPLQAALASRAGAGRVGVGLVLLMPVARRLSRKVSPT